MGGLTRPLPSGLGERGGEGGGVWWVVETSRVVDAAAGGRGLGKSL